MTMVYLNSASNSKSIHKQHNLNCTGRNPHQILEGGWISSQEQKQRRKHVDGESSHSKPRRQLSPTASGGDHDTTRPSPLLPNNGLINDEEMNVKTTEFRRSSASSSFSAMDNYSINAELRAEKYVDHPLVRNMILTQRVRTAALELDGQKQICYTKSNEGWFRTLFVLEGRALDQILIPWIVVTINAVIWTCVSEMVLPPLNPDDFIAFEGFVSLVATATLSFLLVFRLNRSAERYWVAREAWGKIIAISRCMVSGVLVHGTHDPTTRDDVIRWIAAFAVCSCTFMHGNKGIPPALLAGIIDGVQLQNLEDTPHPPVYAMDQIRWNLQKLLSIDGDTPLGVAQSRTQQLALLEEELNQSMMSTGAMERIKSTPLPLVYVTHLRTWLFLFLFCMPYIWVASLGWMTIPTVCLSGFAYLGLDGAAREVEAPFSRDRVNHLSMDAFVLTLMNNILQQIESAADRDLHSTQNHKNICPSLTGIKNHDDPSSTIQLQEDLDSPLHSITEKNGDNDSQSVEVVSA
jgi:ion channel-forming bestrophin family protein